jgi:DeoR family ulaG and ulaABCDEF operon transcriptional repressor
MLEHERKKTILRLLDLRSFANIHEVVEATGASEATIRRDFGEMEKAKLVRRLRGGVELTRPRDGSEPPLDDRMSINHEKKRRIARKACSFIHDGDTVMIDGGSTTIHMVEYLASFSITVITNSFAIAQHLVTHSRCTVILPEGTVNQSSMLIECNLSADGFANYHAAKAFMGIQGITETVLTNSEPMMIQAKRAMIDHSEELIILADDSKFGAICHLTVCPVEKASKIITTKEADNALVASLRSKGIDMILV